MHTTTSGHVPAPGQCHKTGQVPHGCCSSTSLLWNVPCSDYISPLCAEYLHHHTLLSGLASMLSHWTGDGNTAHLPSSNHGESEGFVGVVQTLLAGGAEGVASR